MTFGYSSSGGSLFTTDKNLGHGGRSPTGADVKTKIPNNAKDVWLVPANGSTAFQQFFHA